MHSASFFFPFLQWRNVIPRGKKKRKESFSRFYSVKKNNLPTLKLQLCKQLGSILPTDVYFGFDVIESCTLVLAVIETIPSPLILGMRRPTGTFEACLLF